MKLPWSAKSLYLLAAGAALGFLSIGLGALVVIEFGLFDTTATKPHGAVVAWVTHDAMIRSVEMRSARIKAPASFTQAQVIAGFGEYDGKCAVCHGGPGVPRQTWVSGITPTPPYILDSARHWTPAQLNFIVAEGVKMTAMPGWRTTLSDAKVWDIVAFLEVLPNTTANQYAAMTAAAAQQPARPKP